MPWGHAAAWEFEPATGTGRFATFDDARISDIVTHGGEDYLWWGPTTEFTLANVARIDIVPAPAPPGALNLLLAAALLPLAARLRRTRANDRPTRL